MEEENLTQIWKQYSQIKQYLSGKDYYEQLEMNIILQRESSGRT